MFDIAPTELMLVAVVALVVIGPKDLPKAMRFVGHWVGRARGITRQFRSGFDAMVREAELAEMEKKWADENARIMREHSSDQPALNAPDRGGGADSANGPVMLEQPHLPRADDEPILVERPEIRDMREDETPPPSEKPDER